MVSLPAALVLAQVCAAEADPTTLLSVVSVESGFDPWAIGVNGSPRQSLHPSSREAAVRLAERLLAQGRSLDLGLGQINDRTLARLGLSLDDAFDPCHNLAAAQRVLHAQGSIAVGASAEAWARALSRYNTGDPARGLSNGYVAKVIRAVAEIGPGLAQLRATPPAPPSPSGPSGSDFVIFPPRLTTTGDLP